MMLARTTLRGRGGFRAAEAAGGGASCPACGGLASPGELPLDPDSVRCRVRPPLGLDQLLPRLDTVPPEELVHVHFPLARWL